ncbi:MAG: peptide-methionine (S)-S-oxide reductase MsrA [Pseudomonadales bacterium]|nr:peptide-methionine (S)-S-oxide reductase MsrA [Pseudomonadales bacterium]
MKIINIRLFCLLFMGLFAANVIAEPKADNETAIFASGCFWCTEKDFESVKGVTSAVSGYIGGTQENPTYKEVSKGVTGHTEAVLVTYDPQVVNYEQLLRVYWYSVDPYVKDRQFCDSGTQYRSAIFYSDEKQRKAALASLEKLKADHNISQEIFTEIVPANKFWQAEDYHQDYYKNNPVRYNFYRFNCGRDQRLEKIWGENAGWKPNKK